jgi:hypothetical protein
MAQHVRVDWHAKFDTDKVPTNSDTERRFIACNHGVQVILDAGLVIETLYCTQRTGGLTQGILCVQYTKEASDDL